MQFVQGIHEIHHNYQGFIVDLWGVVHNGHQLFPSVMECLSHIRKLQKPLLFLTNSSYRANRMVEHLESLGIERSFFHDLHSSGEDVFEHLTEFPQQGHCFILGHPGEWAQEKELHLTFSTTLEESRFILCTNPPTPEAGQFDDILQKALHLQIPMICINPDLTAIHGNQQMLCAGTIAQRYEQMGGTVTYHGKPHPRVYKRALEKMGNCDASTILAIGDSLRTDIRGAHCAGINSLLVMTGLEGAALNIQDDFFLPAEKIMTHCKSKGQEPTYICGALRW